MNTSVRVEPFTLREFDGSIAVRKAAGNKPFSNLSKRKDEAPPPPPPPPSFSEEQLKAAERESYKKGFLEGVQEGRNQQLNEQGAIERQLAITVERFAATVSPLLSDYREVVLRMRQDMPKIALCVARKAAGSSLAANAQAVVDEISQRCVEIMIGEPKLVVTVHETLKDALKANLDALAARLQSAAEIVVAGDATIPEADCRIEWKHGAFARDSKQLWAALEQAIDNMVASEKHQAEAQLATVQAEITARETSTEPKE